MFFAQQQQQPAQCVGFIPTCFPCCRPSAQRTPADVVLLTLFPFSTPPLPLQAWAAGSVLPCRPNSYSHLLSIQLLTLPPLTNLCTPPLQAWARVGSRFSPAMSLHQHIPHPFCIQLLTMPPPFHHHCPPPPPTHFLPPRPGQGWAADPVLPQGLPVSHPTAGAAGQPADSLHDTRHSTQGHQQARQRTGERGQAQDRKHHLIHQGQALGVLCCAVLRCGAASGICAVLRSVTLNPRAPGRTVIVGLSFSCRLVRWRCAALPSCRCLRVMGCGLWCPMLPCQVVACCSHAVPCRAAAAV